jgi:hypothetical protein
MNNSVKELYYQAISDITNEKQGYLKRLSEWDDEIRLLKIEEEDLREAIKICENDINLFQKCLKGDPDEFTRIFTLVSNFASPDCSKRLNIYGVNCTSNSLQAIDGHRGIEYFCEIPDNLKGKIIKPNVFENFDQHIVQGSNFIDIHEYLPKFVGTSIAPLSKKASEWIDIFIENSKPYKSNSLSNFQPDKYKAICEIEGIQVGFNKVYVADLFALIDDDEYVSLYWRGNALESLLFYTNKLNAIICPIRI